ncbi:DUF1351 domain-containing protein [Lactobacillus sp.]|uniref:DUF1351 domain-containing protein n=1 Tax=Lactobacillus sp. TaxID=1591 RepID=UPI00198F25B0|nr:DUF1351 domain-containing protein [Lactobacillus sp.]MBD5430119.1 DUF1351 domain-containing protein [Lactobacillus sp.]
MEKSLIAFENQDYPISIQAAEIDFPGYEELKKRVDKLTNDWKGYVVTAESIDADKRTKRELNRLAKSLNQRRIQINREASKPIDEFKKQIDGLVKEIKDVSDQMNKGIKFYDEKLREDKKKHNLERLSKIATGYGLDISEIEYDDKWSNKSTGWTYIENSARERMENVVQTKKQRQEIEDTIRVKADELNQIADRYIEMLDKHSLADVLHQMNVDHQIVVETAKRQAETKKKEQASLASHGNKAINPETGEIVDDIKIALLKIQGTTTQMKALASFMKDWGIKVLGSKEVSK